MVDFPAANDDWKAHANWVLKYNIRPRPETALSKLLFHELEKATERWDFPEQKRLLEKLGKLREARS